MVDILHQKHRYCQGGAEGKIKKLGKAKKALAISQEMWYYIQAFERSAYAPVAQLDRVTDYESVGRGFESLLAYHCECSYRI